MKKEEKDLIKEARSEMDENAISEALFQIQTVLERVFQKGIEIGETIGYTKAMVKNSEKASKGRCKASAKKKEHE